MNLLERKVCVFFSVIMLPISPCILDSVSVCMFLSIIIFKKLKSMNSFKGKCVCVCVSLSDYSYNTFIIIMNLLKRKGVYVTLNNYLCNIFIIS